MKHLPASEGSARLYRRLWRGLLLQPGRLSIGMGSLFLGVLLRIVEPWPLQFVIDHVLLPVDQQTGQPMTSGFGRDEAVFWLTVSALALVCIASVRAAADYMNSVVFSLMGNQVIGQLRGDLYRHLQGLSLGFHGRSRSGDLTLRLVSDMNMLKDVAVTAVLPMIASLLLLVGMFSYMIYLNWRLGLLVLLVVPVFHWVAARKTRKIHQAAKEQRRREGALAATAAESMAAIKTIQAHGAEGRFARSFASQNSRSMKDGVKTGRLTAGLERSVDIMVALASALVLWLGSRYVLEGTLTAGGLVAYLAYLKRGFKPLQDFAKYTGRISKARAAGDRIAELLEQVPEVTDHDNAVPAPILQGEIELDGLSFSYPKGCQVLSKVSLHLPAGSRVAIIGASGIGKSTLLALLLRLHRPTAGRILLDGQEVSQWTLASVRQQMGLVMQENVIFAGTVRDNICLGVDGVPDEKVLQAAQLACCEDFLAEQGLDTEVGERGNNLSQGQRQRVVLARSILNNRPILLLDEPTSNLDPVSRKKVMQAIGNAAQQRTTLLVTHDMELANQMDGCLRMHNGDLFWERPLGGDQVIHPDQETARWDYEPASGR